MQELESFNFSMEELMRASDKDASLKLAQCYTDLKEKNLQIEELSDELKAVQLLYQKERELREQLQLTVDSESRAHRTFISETETQELRRQVDEQKQLIETLKQTCEAIKDLYRKKDKTKEEILVKLRSDHDDLLKEKEELDTVCQELTDKVLA